MLQPTSEELPEPTFMAAVLGLYVIALERRFPGITREVLDLAAARRIEENVIRIRGASQHKEVVKQFRLAERWLALLSVTVDAELGPLAKRRRKKAGR